MKNQTTETMTAEPVKDPIQTCEQVPPVTEIKKCGKKPKREDSLEQQQPAESIPANAEDTVSEPRSCEAVIDDGISGYSLTDAEKKEFEIQDADVPMVEAAVTNIKTLEGKTVESMIAIGKELKEIKKSLPRTFQKFCEQNLGYSNSTAQNFMNTYTRFGDKIGEIKKISSSAVQELSKKMYIDTGIPEKVISEVNSEKIPGSYTGIIERIKELKYDLLQKPKKDKPFDFDKRLELLKTSIDILLGELKNSDTESKSGVFSKALALFQNAISRINDMSESENDNSDSDAKLFQ